MALYTISDLHLPIGVNKPMDIFGSKWINYVEKLKNNWEKIITAKDTVILGGDFSWAMYIDEAKADFEFLEALPGKKIILKGNHDYWWTTMSKLNKFLEQNNFSSISFLQNNSFICDDVAICGTRGWSYLGVGDASDEDMKIYQRELGRLELSIKSAKEKNPREIIAFMHYPPVLKEEFNTGFSKLLEENGVGRCFYGHLHNALYQNVCEGVYNGVEYKLVSCDYIDFIPYKITL